MDDSEIHIAKHGDSEEARLPIVIDMGKIRSKRIKQLQKGEGPLVQSVEAAIHSVREQLKGDLKGKELVPVVLVYRKKPKTPLKRSFLNPLGLR